MNFFVANRALLRLCCRGLCGRFARLRRVYEFSTLTVKNRIHAELLRLATLAPRDGKRARRRTGCREHVKECEMDDQAFDELKCG